MARDRPVRQTAQLSDDEALSRYAATRDAALLDRLVRRWMPLARDMARRYATTTEPFDDLVQVAALGLVNALQRYEPGRGAGFAAYAAPTILGELKRHFRDRTWVVRVPRRLQERALAVAAARDRLSPGLRHPPSVAELADDLGLAGDEVLEALEALDAYALASLDAPAGPDAEHGTLGECVGHADDGFSRAEVRSTLAPALQELEDRDRQMLHLRFEADLNQREIAEVLGTSKVQISRRMHRSLDALRAGLDPAPAVRRLAA